MGLDHTGEVCRGEMHTWVGEQPPLQPQMGKVLAVNVSRIILYIPCPRFLDELIEFKSFPSAYSIKEATPFE